MAICLGKDGDRLDPHLLAREDHPEGDFTTIRDKYFLEHNSSRPDGEKLFAVFNRLTVLNKDADYFSRHIRFDLVH